MIEVNRTNERREPDMFDVSGSLRRIVQTVRSHEWMVLLALLVTVGLVTLYVIFWPPVYEATVLMMVERESDPSRDSFYHGWNVFRKDDARTEIELLTAGPVLREVIETEGLGYDDVYHSFFAHAAYLWERSLIGRKYRQIKDWFNPPDTANLPTPEQMALGRSIIGLRDGVSIKPIGESYAGRLTVRGPSRRVAEVANRLMDVYLAHRAIRYGSEAQKSHHILTQQVELSAQELHDLEQRRVVFCEENGMAFDFQKESLEVEKLTELETNISTQRTIIAAQSASLAEVEKQLETEPPSRTTSTAFGLNAVREATKLKRLELQTTLIHALNRYRDDSPEVQEIKANLAKLEAMVVEAPEMVGAGTTEGINVVRQELIVKRNTLGADLEGARASLAVLAETAANLRSRLAAVPAKRAWLADLDRRHTLVEVTYQQLVEKQIQSSVSLATARAAISSMRIIEYASPPARKSWPQNKILFPSALVMGLVLGIGGALTRSYTSGRVYRERVEKDGSPMPVYGRISVATRGHPVIVKPSRALRAIDDSELSESR